jgi:hypothetical protein
MKQTDSFDFKVGDTVFYLGVKCRIVSIQSIGTQYHPYFRLVPNEESTKHKTDLITKYGISYVLCEKPS